jgi:hypothetical protein
VAAIGILSLEARHTWESFLYLLNKHVVRQRDVGFSCPAGNRHPDEGLAEGDWCVQNEDIR